jgi:hypothetical protein
MKLLIDELRDKYKFTTDDYLKLLNFIDHYEAIISYTIANEWNYVYESIMGDGVEPRETVLWDAIMCDYIMRGGAKPAQRFNYEFKSFKVTDDGVLSNREEIENEHTIDDETKYE